MPYVYIWSTIERVFGVYVHALRTLYLYFNRGTDAAHVQ